MPQPEPGLDTLIDGLRALPAGDRKAILARLGPAERARVRERLRIPADPITASPWSADLARLVLDPAAAAGLTPAARNALADAAAAEAGESSVPVPAPSLADALFGWLRPAGGAA